MEQQVNKHTLRSWLSFKNIVTYVFFFTFFFSFTPVLYKNIQKYIKNTTVPHTLIGCLPINGMIVDSTYYSKQLSKFADRPDIKAILIKIKSPGGLPGASQSIFSSINKAKAKKPVVVFIEDMAASGGYYIASSGHKIIASPSALVGNIGARLTLPNIRELLAHHKIQVNEISSGKFKTSGSYWKENSPEELAYFQAISDDIYKQFMKDVASQRNISLAHYKQWAEGKVFTGNQALALNLVDRLGSLDEAQEEISKLIVECGGKVEGKIKYLHPKTPSPWMKFFHGNTPEESTSISLSASFAQFILNTYHHLISSEQSGASL